MSKTLADLVEDRFGLPSDAGRNVPAEGCLDTILSHRTHRRFRDAPVSEEHLQLILSAGFSAPAKSDLQQSGVVLIKDAAKRKTIAGLIPGMPWIGTAPVFMVMIGDNRRIHRIAERAGKTFANDHLDSFLNAAVDTGLVLQNMILAAESLGLGCCPISVIRNHAAAISDLLELPSYVFPLAGLCIGHPAQTGYVSLRLPLEMTVHTDRYDDSQFDTALTGYDKRRHDRYAIPPEKQRMNAEYGQADFYGWSEDKARQTSVRERADFGAYIRKQGFDLS